MTKRWYESKTVWVAVITALMGVGGLVADFLGVGDFTPQSVTLLVVGVLNIVLRVFFTDTPIEL